MKPVAQTGILLDNLLESTIDDIDFDVFDAFAALHCTMFRRVGYYLQTANRIVNGESLVNQYPETTWGEALWQANQQLETLKLVGWDGEPDYVGFGKRYLPKLVLDYFGTAMSKYFGIYNPSGPKVRNHLKSDISYYLSRQVSPHQLTRGC